MKKILVTTLALSLAVISSLDARQMVQRRSRSMSQPVTKKEAARAMNANAADITNPNVAPAEKKNAATELLALLKSNPNEFELGQLYIQRKGKMTEVQAKQDAMKAMNVGWFDFSNVDYKKAKDELSTLKTELKDINQKIAAQEKVVGRESSNAVRNAIGSLVVVLGLAAVDYYFGSPVRTFITTKGGAFMTEAGGYLSSARAKLSEYADAYAPERLTGAAARKADLDAKMTKQKQLKDQEQLAETLNQEQLAETLNQEQTNK